LILSRPCQSADAQRTAAGGKLQAQWVVVASSCIEIRAIKKSSAPR